MVHVAGCFGHKLPYSVHIAFWRLIRKLTEHYHKENWVNHIAWTNLAKCAPSNGGNPSKAFGVLRKSRTKSLCVSTLKCSIRGLSFLSPWDGAMSSSSHLWGRSSILVNVPSERGRSMVDLSLPANVLKDAQKTRLQNASVQRLTNS